AAPGRLTSLVSAAAVIAGVAAVAYTGNLPGPAQRLAHDTIAAPPAKHHPPAPASSSPSPRANPARQTPHSMHPATGTPPTASPSTGTPTRTTLCDAFWNTLQHSQDGAPPSWQTPQYKKLSTAAGGPRHVYAYCQPVWSHQYPAQYPKLHSYPPYFPRPRHTGSPPTHWQQPSSGPSGDSGGYPGKPTSGSPPPGGGAPGAGDPGAPQPGPGY
ncbi:MAG: hypothetical protein J2P25_23410, partial [Nocardiopsaceae bacterium]|nr:hypothetical protein [Nocardiopsaceae bacterium]